MIKTCLYNFIKCLKYYFVPLLFIVFGACIGFFITNSNINSLSKEIVSNLNQVINSNVLQADELKNFGVSAAKNLNWSVFSDAIKHLNSKEFLDDVIVNYCYSKNITLDREMIISYINGYSLQLGKYIQIMAICLLGSYFAGYFITRSLIRKKIAKISLIKNILITLIDMILATTITGFVTTMLALLGVHSVLSSFILILIYNAISLIEAYFGHRNNKTKFRKVLNIKNCFTLYISSLIISIISIFVTYILNLSLNSFYSTILLIPFSIISLTVVNLNAESYVIKLNENTL